MDELVGVVIIGRNEGQRLDAALRAVCAQAQTIVYVDSASTDGSVALARGLGVPLVELTLTRPLTAARARNAGLAALLDRRPDLAYVQFVDGDCVLDTKWLALAHAFLQARPEIAVVAGRRNERFPRAGVYNRLADIEWNFAPFGPVDACGGDAMMRVDALRMVGGFDERFIAGEEPELCARLRERDWLIWHLDAAMTTHDIAMTDVRQWWRRNVRAGHAYADVAWHRRRHPERFWWRENISNATWGGVVPLLALAAAPATRGRSIFVAASAYVWLGRRVFRATRRRGYSAGDAARFACACVAGKAPQFWGQLKFIRGRQSRLIEYKSYRERSID